MNHYKTILFDFDGTLLYTVEDLANAVNHAIGLRGYPTHSTAAIERMVGNIEAAIAYNKAIDLLKKAGVTKRFLPNYLENLSPMAYADIYARVPISDKILHYLRE